MFMLYYRYDLVIETKLTKLNHNNMLDEPNMAENKITWFKDVLVLID